MKMGGNFIRTIRLVKAQPVDISLARIELCGTPDGGGVEECTPDYGRC